MKTQLEVKSTRTADVLCFFSSKVTPGIDYVYIPRVEYENTPVRTSYMPRIEYENTSRGTISKPSSSLTGGEHTTNKAASSIFFVEICP